MESSSPQDLDRARHGVPLTWASVLLLSLAGGLVVGAIVFVCFPLRYTAATSLLTSEISQRNWLAEMARSSVPGLGSGNGGALTGIRVEAILKSLRIRKTVAATTGTAERLGVSEPEALRVLAGMTTMRQAPGGVLTVEVTTTGPSRCQQWLGRGDTLKTTQTKQLTADVANAYVEALRTYLGEADHENIEFITASRDEVAKQLEQIEDELQAFRSQHGIVDPQRDLDLLGNAAKSANEAYAAALAEQAGVASSLKAARSRLSGQTATRLQQVIESRNPVITDLTQKLADARVSLKAAQAAGKTDTHPDVLELQDTIKATEGELQGVATEVETQVSRGANPTYDEVVSKVIALEISHADVRARCARYRTDFEGVRGRLASLPPVMRRYGELDLQQQLKSELLLNIAKQLEAARLEEKRKSTDKFQVLDEAVPPTRKSGPSAPRSAAMTAVLLAVLLGVVALRRSGLLSGNGMEQP